MKKRQFHVLPAKVKTGKSKANAETGTATRSRCRGNTALLPYLRFEAIYVKQVIFVYGMPLPTKAARTVSIKHGSAPNMRYPNPLLRQLFLTSRVKQFNGPNTT